VPNTKTVERLQQEKEFLVAARSGDLDKVKKFVAKGIDTDAKGEDGGTALHAASTWGRLNTVQYLIETCHVHAEAKTNAGRTALHNACESGKLNIVHFLMKKCQVYKEAKDETGWTPLHCASANGHLNIVQFAIEKCHVDKESKTNGGWTPLHFACGNGHCKVVQYLIEECHVIAEATDNDGQTAYDIARRQNQSSVLQYLEKARADSTTTKINCVDSAKGNTVADQVCQVLSCHVPSDTYLITHAQIYLSNKCPTVNSKSDKF
jgi:ankyrin repeat protein